MFLCFCVFTISSANSQQIFIKFRFPESTWNCPGLGWKKIRKNPDSGKKTGLLCLFPTFGLQFSTNFYRFWFSRVLRSPRVTWCKKIPEKSGFREKSGLYIFPDFYKNGFFALFCGNKVFLVFQNINLNSHCGPWKIRMRLACACVRKRFSVLCNDAQCYRSTKMRHFRQPFLI